MYYAEKLLTNTLDSLTEEKAVIKQSVGADPVECSANLKENHFKHS